MTSTENNIIFIGTKDPISFTYYHKNGFVMQDIYRFYSLEHWFTYSRAKVFGQDSLAKQLLFTRDRNILQSLKNKLEKLTKNSNEKDRAVYWSKNRAEFMNEAIVSLIESSRDVQTFLKEHRYDFFAVNTPNPFWGIGLAKNDFKTSVDDGATVREIYHQAMIPKDEHSKPPKNKMGTLWMDVRDAWFEQGRDKIELVVESPPKPKPYAKPREVLDTMNRFKFLKDELENEENEEEEEKEDERV